MENLEKYGVKQMAVNELVSVDGGRCKTGEHTNTGRFLRGLRIVAFGIVIKRGHACC